MQMHIEEFADIIANLPATQGFMELQARIAREVTLGILNASKDRLGSPDAEQIYQSLLPDDGTREWAMRHYGPNGDRIG